MASPHVCGPRYLSFTSTQITASTKPLVPVCQKIAWTTHWLQLAAILPPTLDWSILLLGYFPSTLMGENEWRQTERANQWAFKTSSIFSLFWECGTKAYNCFADWTCLNAGWLKQLKCTSAPFWAKGQRRLGVTLQNTSISLRPNTPLHQS